MGLVLLSRVVQLLVFLLPPYVANATPVVASKLYRPGHPIDLGTVFVDGERLLGDNKTIEGFISGVVTGTLTGAVLGLMGLNSVYEAFVMSVGAMIGDCAGSFVKRRLKLRPGQRALVLDELPFIIVALLLYSVCVEPLKLETWVASVLITLPLHILTNRIASILGLR